MLTFPPSSPLDQLAGLPAVTRAKGLISGLIRQMSIEAVKGGRMQARPRLLQRPDPSPAWGRARFVGVQVEDYLTHGNAVHLVTSRHVSTGLPSSAMWIPAVELGVTDERRYGGKLRYWWGGVELPIDDVVHVARGADPRMPVRGMGVIEQHLTTWSRLTKQANAESDAYDHSGVPSVAVITPNADLSPAEAEAAKVSWMEKFQRREPVILPTGTEVKPLAWSPVDSQMVEAREMSLKDVANAFGMDGAWLGASTKGLTYKSIGPLFLGLVRETIEPVSDDFEQIWGESWLPGGTELAFTKADILTDDLPTEMSWIGDAVDRGLITPDEGRTRLGYSKMEETNV